MLGASNGTVLIGIVPLPLCVPDLAARLPSAVSLTAGAGCGVGQENDLPGGLPTEARPGPKSKKGSLP